MKNCLRSIFLLSVFLYPLANASAQTSPQQLKALVDDALLSQFRSYLENEIVALSVENQNVRYKSLSEDEISKLDETWTQERSAATKPLISATLSNPLSSYLTRIQAHSGGVLLEAFIMDHNGLNVGQSAISSDFWQGDEAKWQKTYRDGGDIFIDEPELDEDLNVWKTQVNMTVKNADNEKIGAVTFEVNLTELQRRKAGVSLF